MYFLSLSVVVDRHDGKCHLEFSCTPKFPTDPDDNVKGYGTLSAGLACFTAVPDKSVE